MGRLGQIEQTPAQRGVRLKVNEGTYVTVLVLERRYPGTGCGLPSARAYACGWRPGEPERNRSDATARDLPQVLNAFSQFDDPFLHDTDAHAFLLRITGQQLT